MKESHTAYSANVLKVTVETNCPQGGDRGHGGKTTLTFEDEGDTAMAVKPLRIGDGFILEFLGDSECRTVIECLRFAADRLEAQWLKNGGRHETFETRRDVTPAITEPTEASL